MKKGILLLSISLSFAFSLECKYYTVQKGDTLEKVAKKEGVSLEKLKEANKGLKEKTLQVGQKICIPVKKVKSKEVPYAVYKVRKGDTLESVASQFGVSPKVLKEFNNLKSDKLVEGQELKIPPKNLKTAGQEGGQGEKVSYELYTVKKGGRLEHVSKATGIPLKELERLNPELKGKWLPSGTQVKVPKSRKEKIEKDYETFVVKKGGRLEHVSKATGVPLKELEALNPELKGKWLKAGTEVKVPKREVEKTAKKEEKDYTFYKVKKSGTTLRHVSKATGIPLKELERLNPELKNKRLQAGTRVRIPIREEKPETQTANKEQERKVVKELERDTGREASKLNLSGSLPPPVEGKLVKVSKGVEISAPCSSPVKAVEDGRVIYSGGDLQAYGNMVIIEHEGFISLYAYNQENLVKRGERVSKGQVIAKVGKKNNSEECALRFELRNKEGVPLDPTEYIKDLQ